MLRREPILNAPRSVLVLLGVLAAIHAGRWLLTERQDETFLLSLAFIPGRYLVDGQDLPGGEAARLWSPFTHMLLHGDLTHLLINSAWLLVFGSIVARRIGGARFLLFFVFCGLGGVATFWLFNPGLLAPMIGASGAISGLLAAVLRFLFNATDRGYPALGPSARPVPLMSIGQTLTDRRAALTIVIWMVLNAVLAFGFVDLAPQGGIAWEAHVGGFWAGFLTFGFFDRAPPQAAATTFH